MTDVLRAAIEQSGLTGTESPRRPGLPIGNLGRFMRGETSLRLDKADRLAAYLGLRLVPDPDAKPPDTDAGKPGTADAGEAKGRNERRSDRPRTKGERTKGEIMGTVFRKTATKPLPAGAKIIVRKGQRLAEWKDAKGKTPDGTR